MSSPLEQAAHNEWVRLVLGLTPPGRGHRYSFTAPPQQATRDRFVLFVLAYFADTAGLCQVSVPELVAITHMSAQQVRDSIRQWEDHGVVIATQERPNDPNHYRLVRPVLEREQLTAKQYAQGLVEVIVWFGADTRALNVLKRGRVATMAQLGELIEQWRALPELERAAGFHVFLMDRLSVTGVGDVTGPRILAAFDAWQADRAGLGADQPADQPAVTPGPAM
jgi:hypothetical protein